MKIELKDFAIHFLMSTYYPIYDNFIIKSVIQNGSDLEISYKVLYELNNSYSPIFKTPIFDFKNHKLFIEYKRDKLLESLNI